MISAVLKILCLFKASRSTRSLKVAKKRRKTNTKKPKVAKKAKPLVKKSVSPPVTMETVPRTYWD